MASVGQLETVVLELKKKEAQLKRKEEELQKQEEFVGNHSLIKSKKIKLNVGGKYFATSPTTLQAEPNSMLAVMFSGRFPIEPEEDGAYFIDRNGKVFGLILDWLRTGQLSPSLSSIEEFYLQIEADYYQLTKLSKLLQNKQKSETEKIVTDCIILCADRQQDYYDFNTSDLAKIKQYVLNGYTPVSLPSKQAQLCLIKYQS